MPIYEFICQECRQVFELVAIKRSDEGAVRCPHCGGENLERIMSKVNLSSGNPSGANKPAVENRSCSSITLPGHTR